jgi:hypothetical protein
MGYKALLVGINAYDEMPLRGCVNDVTRMRELLQQQYHLSDAQIRILQDEAATHAAITDGLRWLAETDGTATPPVRLFHFSGHGTYAVDEQGDEPDGQDEVLVPYDYGSAGGLRDDTLRGLYDGFPPESHLILSMDCCHSGTLHFGTADDADVVPRFLSVSAEEQARIDAARQQFEQRRQAFVQQKEAAWRNQQISQEEYYQAIEQYDRKQRFGTGIAADIAVILAGARDTQTAADARLAGSFYGAFSYYLTEILRGDGAKMSYPSLIDQVGAALRANKFTQEPQLHGNAEHIKRAFMNVVFH